MKGNLEDVLNYKLFESDGFTIDLKWLITLVVYIGMAVLALYLIRKLLKTATKNNWWIGYPREKSVYNSVKFPILLILFEESLSLFGDTHIITEILNYPIIDSESINLTLKKILVFISIILLMRFFITLIEFVTHRSLRDKHWINNSTEYSFVKLISYGLYIIAIFIGIKAMGINISLLLGASAAILVGIGFGLQDIFRDFISGILILFEGNFKVGDIIEYNNIVARVTRIDLRTSRVITRDGNRILIPNSMLISNEITNWSISNPDTRFTIEVGVAYGSDVVLVKGVLLDCANDHHDVIRKNDTIVLFNEFADSSLNFKLMFWCSKTWDENQYKSEIRFAIDKAFRENNIRIPFPQRDLHVIEMPEKKV
jgi:small-conductance mechanosensitive channel